MISQYSKPILDSPPPISLSMHHLFANLSQVNAIQQMENVAAYPFLKDRLDKRDLHLHAFWFDVHSGNVFLLSRQRQRFVEVNERSYFTLMEEVKAMAA